MSNYAAPKRAILQRLLQGDASTLDLARAAAIGALDVQRLVRELARDGHLSGGGTIPLRVTEAGRTWLGGAGA